MVRVRLSGILTPADWSSVRHLRRGPGQHRYLNSMEEIQNEAREDERAKPHPWAIHDADTGALVGFTMISDNIPEPIDDDLVGPYFLWKLLIDHSVQGRGYGRPRWKRWSGISRLDPVPTCCTPAAPMVQVRPAGSIWPLASLTLDETCGARRPRTPPHPATSTTKPNRQN